MGEADVGPWRLGPQTFAASRAPDNLWVRQVSSAVADGRRQERLSAERLAAKQRPRAAQEAWSSLRYR